MEEQLKVVRSVLNSSPQVKIPQHYDRVYKDECMFSFATAFSQGGIFINLHTWQGFGQEFVALDQERTGNRLYLHESALKIPVAKEVNEAVPEKLAIGGAGGFQVDAEKFDVEKEQALVVVPENLRIPLPQPALPELILTAIAAINAHDSVNLQDETAAWEDEKVESKFAADLPQLDVGMGKFGRHIPNNPALWACDETGVTENLWLNLSTGFIGSGRQNWDGSGGNGAAVRHFEATGKQYPLAVKLGTITPRGGDVFSYAEDDMVTDAKLRAVADAQAEHLRHWGINMMSMQKTEKTMAEMEIDLNMSYEYDRITESGAHLQPLTGPGYIGLQNLGNSCYMNSVLQLLWTIPEFQQRYADQAKSIFKSSPEDPGTDLATQLAKVGNALCTGNVGEPAHDVNGSKESKVDENTKPKDQGVSVRPRAFKMLVGRGHPEFSSARQQDASEYFQYLLDLVNRAELANQQRLDSGGSKSSSVFDFAVETRVQCAESGYVSYKRDAPSNVLSLNIPVDAANNKNEVSQYQEREAKRAKLKENDAAVYISQEGTASQNRVVSNNQEEKVLPRVPLSACVGSWMAEEEMSDYFSAVLARKSRALKRNRLASFPPFLVIQLNRFYLASDWTPKKLEVLVDVPDQLDLEPLRGKGAQPGENLQPEEPAQSAENPSEAPQVLQPDPATVTALMEMGFSENGSKRAAVATQNGGTEASMNWVLSHLEDADFNDPLPSNEKNAAKDTKDTFLPDQESLVMLQSMGFTDRQATAGLKACQGSLERAADWLFSRASDLDSAVEETLAPTTSQPATATGASASQALEDGPGQYSLVGFVSHMGANTACGHYVCHIRKEGRWVIYNDDKVAVSENPPKELGYLYLFRRNAQ